jgi:hypothetical protein
MATNYPGPYEYRLIYQTVVSSVPKISQLRLSLNVIGTVSPAELYSAIDMESFDTSASDLDAFETDLLNLLKPLFNTSTDFVASELWLYTPGTFSAAYVTGRAIGVVGTSGSGTVQDGQAVISFRGTDGSRGKIDLRQSVLTSGITQTFPTAHSGVNALAAVIAGVSSPVITRKGGFFLIPYKYNPGLNERYFKDRLRF